MYGSCEGADLECRATGTCPSFPPTTVDCIVLPTQDCDCNTQSTSNADASTLRCDAFAYVFLGGNAYRPESSAQIANCDAGVRGIGEVNVDCRL